MVNRQLKLSKSPQLNNLNAHFIGKVLLRYKELESTQEYAHELLSGFSPEEGTVVAAAYQQKGRGMMQNRWESERGQNLLFSLILYPVFLPIGRSFLLSQAMALGVRDWVGSYLGGATVKWPNDVYFGDKKVAGILIQNALSGAKMQHSVVGIGINVNQTDFPAHVPNPGSMKGISGNTFDIDRSMEELFGLLERRYVQLKEGAWSSLEADYLRHLYGKGQLRTFARSDGSTFQGRIAGVAENGFLLIDTGERQEAFEVKEVQFK